MPTYFEQITIRPFFDNEFYLSKYKDVAESGVDPIAHYCQVGLLEGRNPNANFDTEYYLETNQDVKVAGVNPFSHYIGFGKQEGRLPREPNYPLKAQRFRIMSAWRAPEQHSQSVTLGLVLTLDLDELLDVLSHALSHNAMPLALAVSHDDYGESIGGAQDILFAESVAFNARGIAYLHLCPARPMSSLSDETVLGNYVFAVRLNGQGLGQVTADVMNQALIRLKHKQTELLFIVHHMMGHSVNVISTLLKTAAAAQPLFWAHEFFAACSSYALMQNNLGFCGLPPIGSAACRTSVHGQDRLSHASRIRQFITETALCVVAPSHSALEQWTSAAGFIPARAFVAHPAKLFLKRGARPLQLQRPLRIAFVGAQDFHKGWPVFKHLAERLAFHKDYAFFQLGEGDVEVPYVENIGVRVTPENSDLMVKSIGRHNIDAVISWSQWPETFNLVIHEPIASGAFVNARRFGGHVLPAAQFYTRDAMQGVNSEEELYHYFNSGRAAMDIRAVLQYQGVRLISMGSAELVGLDAEKELVP